MNRVLMSVVVVAFSVLPVAVQGQADLPDDVRAILPGAARPSAPSKSPAPSKPAAPQPAPLAPAAPVAPVAAADPAESEVDTDQLLERALLRYRNIVEQGANGQWETDVAERLRRLEAVLKKLAEEQKQAAEATTPVTAPAAKAAPETADAEDKPLTPPEPLAPVKTTASDPKPIVPAKPKSTIKTVSPDADAVIPAVRTTPAETPVPSQPPSPPRARQQRQEPEHLEKLAQVCERLAQELRAAADRLRGKADVAEQ